MSRTAGNVLAFGRLTTEALNNRIIVMILRWFPCRRAATSTTGLPVLQLPGRCQQVRGGLRVDDGLGLLQACLPTALPPALPSTLPKAHRRVSQTLPPAQTHPQPKPYPHPGPVYPKVHPKPVYPHPKPYYPRYKPTYDDGKGVRQDLPRPLRQAGWQSEPLEAQRSLHLRQSGEDLPLPPFQCSCKSFKC